MQLKYLKVCGWSFLFVGFASGLLESEFALVSLKDEELECEHLWKVICNRKGTRCFSFCVFVFAFVFNSLHTNVKIAAET